MLTEFLDKFVLVCDVNHLVTGDFIKSCHTDNLFKGNTLNDSVFYSGGKKIANSK